MNISFCIKIDYEIKSNTPLTKRYDRAHGDLIPYLSVDSDGSYGTLIFNLGTNWAPQNGCKDRNEKYVPRSSHRRSEITLALRWGSISKSPFPASYFPPKFQLHMTNKTNPTTADVLSFSNSEIKKYIYSLQDELQKKLNSGLTMDDILDKEDPFEALEPLLPQEAYPILVLAMINNIRSETVINAVLEGLNRGIKQYRNRNSECS
jgi:hypothetical protein